MTLALTDLSVRVAHLCGVYLRYPVITGQDDVTGAMLHQFNPPLTTAEQATFNDIILFAKLALDSDLSLAEFQAIKPQLAEIRTFRTRTFAQWNALTAAQREADEISYLNDLTDVLRALLRQ